MHVGDKLLKHQCIHVVGRSFAGGGGGSGRPTIDNEGVVPFAVTFLGRVLDLLVVFDVLTPPPRIPSLLAENPGESGMEPLRIPFLGGATGPTTSLFGGSGGREDDVCSSIA